MTSGMTPRTLTIAMVLVLLTTGLTGILGFHRIGRVNAELLEANMTVVTAVGRLLAQIERQERQLGETLIGTRAIGDVQPLERGSGTWEAWAAAGARGGEDAAANRASQIASAWDAYVAALEAYESPMPQAAPGVPLESRFLDALGCLRDLRGELVDLLLSIHSDSAVTESDLRSLALRFAVLILALTSLGTFASLGLHYRLSGLVFAPLSRISRFIDDVALGVADRRLGTQVDPEVNRLAQSCNRLATALQEAAQESRRHLRTERDIATLLAESFSDPVVIVSDAGDIVRANAPARELFSGSAGRVRLKAMRQAIRETQPLFADPETQYRIEPVGGSHDEVGLYSLLRLLPVADPGEG